MLQSYLLPSLRVLDKMPALKTCVWMAMPPTAFLSLASLLTYLVFRLVFLATAKQVEQQNFEDATLNRLRTLALPWIFFGLELIILRKSLKDERYLLRSLLIRQFINSAKCHSISSSNLCHQASCSGKTVLDRRRCPKYRRTYHNLQRGRRRGYGYSESCLCSRLPGR